jgi:hypothetical protein
MVVELEKDEMRWKVLKAMLDEFPTLKKRAKEYLRGQYRGQR